MFSCFNMKPASATVLTLSLFLFDTIIRNVPYFENIQTYFLTHHMAMWTQVFQPAISWRNLFRSVLYLGAFDLVFLLIGGIYFCRRDFKS
jgi:ABC-2 type transport system permease protein